MGSGFGSVGRSVDFDTRGPRFGSSHQPLFSVYCIEKSEKQKVPFLNLNIYEVLQPGCLPCLYIVVPNPLAGTLVRVQIIGDPSELIEQEWVKPCD